MLNAKWVIIIERNNIRICELPVEVRPRERMLIEGAHSLSNQELLAILLRTGTKEESALDLAHKILANFNDLFEMKSATIAELKQVKGIGSVKAIEILAAIEFGLRIQVSQQVKHGKILSSSTIGKMMMVELGSRQQEHLITIYLNTKNEIIMKKIIFIGTLNYAVAHPREIFHWAVKHAAANIILVHNHPSGDTTPSQQDVEFTKRVIEVGKILGIEVLDHVIVASNSYNSLKELALI